jgi:hypothetical protein
MWSAIRALVADCEFFQATDRGAVQIGRFKQGFQ